ncbi:polysaccharide deacetylase [Oscillatoriales cyanobacterium USR001]|nr:polysaccharide deacetylase [Oscillatoriales cyanobacterium USR001]
MNRINKRLRRRNIIDILQVALIPRAKILYILLIFLISLTISGWSVGTDTVRIPILGFHNIIDAQNPAENPPHRLGFTNDYTKQNLAKFLEYLVQQKFWFLTSQDLFVYFINKSKPIPIQHIGQKPIMLTFDDGYKGVHTNGLPLLENLEKIYQEKVKFVLFINPRFLGIDGRDYLSHINCSDLREGYKEGFYDVQSHGFNHKDLAKISPKDLDFELGAAKLALRKCTSDLDKNKIVGAHLAYPFGSTNRKVEKLLPKYYLSGFLYDNNLLRINWFTNQYQISRITVNKKVSIKKLIAIANRASTLKRKKW